MQYKALFVSVGKNKNCFSPLMGKMVMQCHPNRRVKNKKGTFQSPNGENGNAITLIVIVILGLLKVSVP